MATSPRKSLYDFLKSEGIVEVEADRLLAPLMRWRIGGAAVCFVDAVSTEQIVRIRTAMMQRSEPYLIIGDGSNLLMDSKGYKGLVLRVGRGLSGFSRTGNRIVCGAGTWVPHLGLYLARQGLGGLEHIIGIPGTVGGLVTMNGGSQRKGIGSNVVRAKVVKSDGSIAELTNSELNFAYRRSSIQNSGAIITEVELELTPRDPHKIRVEMLSILAERKRKFPKKLPNCGSTFLSDPAMYTKIGPPGKAIELAGLKGTRIGGAQVSPMHANFIVNLGWATSDEVLALISHVRRQVFQHTGFLIDCEARYVDYDGIEAPAHFFTDTGAFDQSLLSHVRNGPSACFAV